MRTHTHGTTCLHSHLEKSTTLLLRLVPIHVIEGNIHIGAIVYVHCSSIFCSIVLEQTAHDGDGCDILSQNSTTLCTLQEG